jgi:protoporphyrinogen oxidase
VKTAILGCGLTGLTIGYLLKKKGIDFKILEKEKTCGGLMRTLRQNGFTFDYGGSHVLFSKDKEALSFLLGLLENNKTGRRRDTRILYKGRYINYPFENGLSGLSKRENFECLYYFVQNLINKQRDNNDKPRNLKEWFYHTFGQGITEKYLIPYNTKIWKYPLDKMALGWADRIPNPPLEDLIKSSIGIKTEGYVQQLNFYYPTKGGIQALIDKLKESTYGRVILGFHIRKVKKEGNVWIVSDGKQEELCDKIVSTIPMNELVKTMDAPKEVKKAANELSHNSLICIMFGLNVKKINGLSWLYIPDRAILSHRVSFPSNYSPYGAPARKSSVLAEITCRGRNTAWEMKDDELVDQVADDLTRLKILKKKDICFSNIRKTEYAYVINDLDCSENTGTIMRFLNQEGIDSIGRFGEYKYLSMDDCTRRATDYVQSFASTRAAGVDR